MGTLAEMQLDSGAPNQHQHVSKRVLTVFASALLVLVGIVAFTGDFSAPVADTTSVSTGASTTTQLASSKKCTFDLTSGYTSTMFPDYDFSTVRSDTGTI